MLVVLTTVPDEAEGTALAEQLVERGLAACAQLLPKMTSFYMWDGAMQRDPEHLMLIKTTGEKWEQVRKFLTEHHSYTVPEIVAIEAEQVSAPYNEWIRAVVG